MWTRLTESAEETHALAARIGARLRPGDVVLLRGDLGAGKTTFVQGLAEGAGVRAPVTSPTFTLIQEYPAPHFALYHFDPYRLAGPQEVEDLGFDEYLERGGAVAVEWAERLGPLQPAEHLAVRIEILGEERRRITLIPSGPHYVGLLAELETEPC